MTHGQWIAQASDVRRELPPEVYAVLADLMSRGWRLRRQGHKFRVYCPCGDGAGHFAINGSPRNPAAHARQLARQAARCPEQHDLDRH